MAERIIAVTWKILIVLCIPVFVMGLMAIVNPAFFDALFGSGQ